MEINTIDQTKAEEFAGHMLNTLNGGFISLAISIGKRTGLFEVMKDMEPSNSFEIASASGLNERYIREWLGTMVTGKIVEYDPITGKYYLPAEHAPFLTEIGGMDNMSLFADTLFSTVDSIDKIVECFHKGGGVKYDEFSQCLHCIKELSIPYYDNLLIDKVLPLIPGLKEKMANGIKVLDIGCGHGHAINVMAQNFPNSSFTGYDLVPDSIREARKEMEEYELNNVRFEVHDVKELNEVNNYDLITAFDAIHDQAHPRKVLSSIAKALKDNGVFLMVDIKASSKLENNLDHMLAPAFYTVSLTHCMTVSLAYNGEGLGTMWGKEKAEELLAEAGFKVSGIYELPEDIMNYYYICQKS